MLTLLKSSFFKVIWPNTNKTKQNSVYFVCCFKSLFFGGLGGRGGGGGDDDFVVVVDGGGGGGGGNLVGAGPSIVWKWVGVNDEIEWFAGEATTSGNAKTTCSSFLADFWNIFLIKWPVVDAEGIGGGGINGGNGNGNLLIVSHSNPSS